MFVVLEPLTPSVEGPGEAPPAGPPPEEVELTLELAPGKRQRTQMPLTRDSAEEFVNLAYIVGGRADVQALLADVNPGAWRGDAAGRERRRRAHELLAEAAQQLDDDVAEALAEVELEARQVFLEMLESARGATQLSLAGLIETAPGALSAPPPSLNAPPYGDGGATYRALRAAVVELDSKARKLHTAEKALEAQMEAQTFVDLRDLFPEDFGDLSARGGVVGLRDVLAKAQSAYAETLLRHAERFPSLPMLAGEILKQTNAQPEGALAAMAADQSSYDNELDRVIRRAIGEAHDKTWESSFRLARSHLEAADKVLARVGRADSPQVLFTRAAVIIPPPAEPSPAEETYAEHPLWRYPLIVHAALERLGTPAGTLPHAAASDVLRLAEQHARRRDASEAQSARTLDWACFGFGVLAFVPVIGQLSLAAAGACAAVQAVNAASSFSERSEQARAFGPYAAQLGLAEPEGAGLLVLAFVGLAFDVLPVWRACGALAARLVRVRALPPPATPGLVDAVATGANFLALATAEAADRAGVTETSR